MKENVDYQLVPDLESEFDKWNIRFLKGRFVETVVSDVVLGYDEDTDAVKYNFSVISSPDDEATSDNADLQEEVLLVISDIIEKEELTRG